MVELISELSLKDLRALIGEAGLSTDGCIDKSDLRAKAKEAAERLKLPGAKQGPVSKPLISTLVAEELGLFDTPEQAAKKKEEAEMALRAAAEAEQAEREWKEAERKRKADEAAAELAAKEAAAKAARDKEEAEKKAAAKAARKEAEALERVEKQRIAKEKAVARAAEAAEAKAILEAVVASDWPKLDELLQGEGKMNVNARADDEQANTALHVATSKTDGTAMVEALLKRGAAPSVVNEQGMTPLHTAAMFNRVEVCKLLLASPSIDVFVADSNGQTARGYAELNQRTEIAAMIEEAEKNADKRKAEAEAAKAAEEAEAKAKEASDARAVSLISKQVRVDGLKARPELNGLVGYVITTTANGRCTVALKVGEEVEQVNLKPANLVEAVEAS